MNKTRQKPSLIALLGLFLLAVTVIALLISTVVEAWLFHSIGGVISLIVLVGAVVAIINEALRILKTSHEGQTQLELIFQVCAVFIGGILAYVLTHHLGLGAVVAASLVAILAHLITPDYSVPAYCGAFIGMTSNALLFNCFEVGIAGIISGLVFILTKQVFNGLGGKLGTIALIGTALTGLSLGRVFLFQPLGDWKTNILIILVALVAAPLTYYLSIRRGHGPVMASAFIGLIAGLILPNILPERGQMLAVVAICASFAGMTSKHRCPTIGAMFITGLFTSIVFVYSTPLLGGAGGKLGTIAFGAVLATCGYAQLFKMIKISLKGK